jgi:hypothetical protein
MPVQWAGEGKRLGELLSGIHHQLGEGFAAAAYLTVFHRFQAHPPCQGRAHRADIQLFTLNRRGRQDILQQRIQFILCADRLADGAEHAQQLALGLSALAQQRREATGLPVEVRPVGVLPDPVRMSHGGMPGVREPNKEVIRLIW